MKYNGNIVHTVDKGKYAFGEVVKLDKGFAICVTPIELQKGITSPIMILRLNTDVNVKRTKLERDGVIHFMLYGSRYCADVMKLEVVPMSKIDGRVGMLSPYTIGCIQYRIFKFFEMDKNDDFNNVKVSLDIEQIMNKYTTIHTVIPTVTVMYDEEYPLEVVQKQLGIVKESIEENRTIYETVKELKLVEYRRVDLEEPKPRGRRAAKDTEEDDAVTISEAISDVSVAPDEPQATEENEGTDTEPMFIERSEELNAIISDIETSEEVDEPELVTDEKPKSESVAVNDTAPEKDDYAMSDFNNLEPSEAELRAIEAMEVKRRKRKYQKSLKREEKPFVKPVRTTHNTTSNLKDLMSQAGEVVNNTVETTDNEANWVQDLSCSNKKLSGRSSSLSDDIIIEALRDKDNMRKGAWGEKWGVTAGNVNTKIGSLEAEAKKRGLKV